LNSGVAQEVEFIASLIHKTLFRFVRAVLRKNTQTGMRVSALAGFLVGSILFGANAQAQTASPTATPAAGSTISQTNDYLSMPTWYDNSGIVTEYMEGKALVLDTGSGDPVHYDISKTVEIVTSDRKPIDATAVKKGAKVYVHLAKDSNGATVDRIILDHAR